MKKTMLSAMAALLGFGLLTVLCLAVNGAVSAANAPQVVHTIRDVVVNEVAWAGHSDHTGDEWIELLNNTAATICLEGWRLVASDGGPSITLGGEIAPNAYYLIERSDDETVSH